MAYTRCLDERSYGTFWMAGYHFQPEGTELMPNIPMKAMHLCGVTRGPRSSTSISATSREKKLDFMEAFPDEGDMDMPRSLAAYRDVGYPYMLMPDHVPQIDGRDPSGVAFAYCYGYIQALIDALVPPPDAASARAAP